MDTQLLVLCALTFVIHLIGTLAYAVRIAGVRTRRIAVSFALFNILVLVSRTSNSFQGPFLAKRIEENIRHGVSTGLLGDFQMLLFSATLATVVGAFLIPTFQRMFSSAVAHFQINRSIPQLVMRVLFRGGLAQVRDVIALPATGHIANMRPTKAVSHGIILLNVFAVALWTIGVFASLYAGYLNPELRVTSSALSSVVNGVSTIMMFVLIDPQMSLMTDDVVEGKLSEPEFRRAIVWLVGSRVAGTLLAQVMLVPAAMTIAAIARRM